MHKNKRATILIYVLILTSVVMFISIIIFNNTIILDNSLNYEIIQNRLNSKILENVEYKSNYYKLLTNNSTWFIDNLSCPDNITMSWDTLYTSWLSLSREKFDSSYVCSWSYDNKVLNVFSNSTFTSFDKSSLDWYLLNLTDDGFWNLSSDWYFTHDNTFMTIPATSYQKPDYVEDNFSSDDDVDSKLYLIWMVTNTGSLENVFWNNKRTSDYINNVPNNNNSEFVKIWNITNWLLFLSIDNDVVIKVVKFDRNKYDSNNSLVSLDEKISNWTIYSWSWYLQNNLSLSTSKTWNEYSFDFKNNDYALFLKNIWPSALTYNIHAETSTWQLIYINPLNDSLPNELKILEWYIYIDSWVFVWKELEFTKTK